MVEHEMSPPEDEVEPRSGSRAEQRPGLPAIVGRAHLYVSHSARSAGVLIPLVLLWIILSFSSPVFLTTLNVSNILVQASVVGILALGSTIVLITEEIDLSIGAVEGLGAVIAAIVAIRLELPWPLAIAAAIGAGTLVGLVNGLITTLVGVPSFITTLGTLGVVSGISLQLTGGESIYGFATAYQWIGQGDLFGIRVPVLFAIAILVVLHFVLKRTTLGMNFYAVGGNRRASELVGVRPSRTKTIALTLNGALAGLAGVIISARLDAANPTFGQNDLLDAIAAVVIGGAALTGGVGSVIGTAFGVLLIVTIRNGLNLLGVSPFWQTSAVGTMIIAAAMIDQLSKRAEKRR